jgi:hypothetical protein
MSERQCSLAAGVTQVGASPVEVCPGVGAGLADSTTTHRGEDEALGFILPGGDELGNDARD